MKILKFGGSSIGTPERITSVINIIKQSKKEYGEIAVVASAIEGITNQLIDASLDLQAKSVNALFTFAKVFYSKL